MALLREQGKQIILDFFVRLVPRSSARWVMEDRYRLINTRIDPQNSEGGSGYFLYKYGMARSRDSIHNNLQIGHYDVLQQFFYFKLHA